MFLPGHNANWPIQLHSILSKRGEMGAFLLEEEKFLVADTSRSTERGNAMTASDLGVRKLAVAVHGKAVLGLDWPA